MDYQEGTEETGNKYETEAFPTFTLNTRVLALVLAAVYVLGSGYFEYNLSTRIAKAEDSQKTIIDSVELRNKALIDQMGATEANLKQSSNDLQFRIGKTQRQIAARSAALRKQVMETERQLRESQQLLASVSNALGGVKTDWPG